MATNSQIKRAKAPLHGGEGIANPPKR